MIPPFKYAFTAQDAETIAGEVRALLTDGAFLTQGAHTAAFEREFAQASGGAHAVAVASGTAALEILLRAAGVDGRRVIVPSNTFGATLVAVLRAGGRPVLVDCGADFCIDPGAVARRLDGGVAAVVAVHIGGAISAGTPEIARLCAQHGAAFVEDAAHATGATLDGRHAGQFGFGAAFSFFSTKVITCGEGGMLVSRHPEVARKARLLRDHAKRPDGGMDETGYNWRLSELQALLGLAQVRRLPEIMAQRRAVAEAYVEALDGLPGVTPVLPTPGAVSNHYKLIVRVPAGTRGRIRERLQHDHGVALGGEVYAVPCHRQAAFRAYAQDLLPMTDALCDGHVCPPIYPGMTAAEVEHATAALRAVLQTELAARPRPADALR